MYIFSNRKPLFKIEFPFNNINICCFSSKQCSLDEKTLKDLKNLQILNGRATEHYLK